MRPAEFTTEQVIEAGKELQAAGRNITGFALRQRVGGGNPARLKMIWDEHVSGQDVVEAEPVAELPVEVAEVVSGVAKALTDRLQALAVDLNDKAVKAAERRVQEAIRAAGEQAQQAERELADAGSTVEDLENKLDEAKTANEQLQARLDAEHEARQAQAVELAQLRERLAHAETAAQAARAEHEQFKKETSKQISDLKFNLQETRDKLHLADRQVDQLRDERNELKVELKDMTAAHNNRRAEIVQLETKEAAAVSKANTAEHQAELATAARDKAIEEAAQLRGQVQILQALVDRFQPGAAPSPAPAADKATTSKKK